VCLAHQPRIIDSDQTVVIEPEISKAYYAKLSGNTQQYIITEDSKFNLYVNILVPATIDPKKDVSAVIYKNGNTDLPFARLDWINFQWTSFFEKFGHDNYRKWPEYSEVVESGTYTIVVNSTNNDSSYSLAIGEIENFDSKESVNALHLIPLIKSRFFNKSPIDFIFSPLGRWTILVMFIMSFLFWLWYRFVLKIFSHSVSHTRAQKNIWWKDRAIRGCIGLGLVLRAITTTRSLRLLFIAGFCFFEAMFSWCALYSAIGKNSCPIE
jgi:Protein of unknown function (DUF2892)